MRLIRLGSTLPLLWGLILWPRSAEEPRWRLREFLDALLFATALFFLVWVLGLGAVIRATPEGAGIWLFFFVAYDLLLGFALYRGMKSPGGLRGPLGWIGLGLLVSLLGNLVSLALNLRGLYRPGSWLDLMALAIPWAYLRAAGSAVPRMGTPGRLERSLTLALPYFPMIVALPLGLRFLARQGFPGDPTGPWLGFSMLGVLLLRQWVAIWDLTAFNRNLEHLVAARTRALEESQEAMVRTERMNLVATLGAGLAHDLNNLLSVAVGGTDIMKMNLAEGLPIEATEVETVRGTTLKAAEMARKLMSLARQRAPLPECFDLNERITAMKPVVTRLAHGKSLTWDLSPQALLLLADPLQLEQILVNVVLNARDALGDQGRIRIRTTPEGQSALLEVEDDGAGMAPEVLGRIFEPLFTTKAPGKGTGLGLASVKLLVEECGGRVGVSSEPGLGTRFSFRFPLAQA